MIAFLGGAKAILQAFQESASAATTIDASVAWASPGPALEALCSSAARGVLARIVIGRDFNGTDPAAIEQLLIAFPGCLRWGQTTSGATFHPKYYLFSDGSSQRLLVGSANLTAVCDRVIHT